MDRRLASVPTVIWMIATLAEPAPGGVLRVPGDHFLIQNALDASNPADTVIVDPGTYFEAALDYGGKSLLLTSTSPCDPAIVRTTVIDAWGSDRVVRFDSQEDSSSVLAGFTLRGGRAGLGGGIACFGTSPRIVHCVIRDNVVEAGYTSIGVGGGVYCVGSTALFSFCEIRGNRAEQYGLGGGGSGGGVFCGFSSPHFTNCRITGNVAEVQQELELAGGGAFFAQDSSSVVISHCVIDSNSTPSTGGGLVFTDDSHPYVGNTIVADNSSGLAGGGLAIGDGADPTIVNSVVVGNTGGGGLHAWQCAPQVSNSIIRGNQPSNITDYTYGRLGVIYSNVSGGWDGEGNIDADPLWWSARDYRYLLRPGSPCVDTGDPNLVDGLYDSDERWPGWFPDAERSDMGAYGGPENERWLHSCWLTRVSNPQLRTLPCTPR